MTARVVLAHCWTGSPDAGWYPRLRRELGAMGFAVDAPALPEPDRPSLAAWLDTLAPLHVARRLVADLGAHVRVVPDRGHFAPASGHTPLPEVRAWAAASLRHLSRHDEP
jgi:predicted alpha/beta hydrolase family esterase